MNNVLYEASFKFELVYLLPALMLIILPFFPSIIQRACQKKNIAINIKFVKIFCGCAFAFVSLLTVIVFAGRADMYNKTVVAYRNGEYDIVEGYVENFDPMPYEGHSEESFEINGVEFRYSDYSVQPGYRRSKSHGGVIIGNGQHLKIGYVYFNEVCGNIIVYIEQLS